MLQVAHDPELVVSYTMMTFAPPASGLGPFERLDGPIQGQD